MDDPIIMISINRAYPEDFLPIVNVLSDIAPFEVCDPQLGEFTNTDKLFYSFDGWMQKNYEEDELSLHYSYHQLS